MSEWWGHDDYEYIVTIRKNDKDCLLLALIEATFGDDASAVSRFRDFAREKDIPTNGSPGRERLSSHTMFTQRLQLPGRWIVEMRRLTNG